MKRLKIGIVLTCLSISGMAADITHEEFITTYCEGGTGNDAAACEAVTTGMGEYFNEGVKVAKSFATSGDIFVGTTAFYVKPLVDTRASTILTFGTEGVPGTITCPVIGHKAVFGKVPDTHTVVFIDAVKSNIVSVTGQSVADVDNWIIAIANALAALGAGDKLILNGIGKMGFTSSGTFTYSSSSVYY